MFSAKLFTYEIGVWDRDGRRRATVRGPLLKERPATFRRPTRDKPPPTRIMAFHSPDNDHLWVLIVHPRPDWLDYMVDGTDLNGPGLVMRPGSSVNDILWSRIDVIDLRTLKVIARKEVPRVLVGFLGNEQVLEQIELPDGTPQLGIWRATLTPGG